MNYRKTINKYLIVAATTLITACSANYPYSRINEIENGVKINSYWINPGEFETIEFAGIPITVYKRTKDDMLWLSSNENPKQILDPNDQRTQQAIERYGKSTISIAWARFFDDGLQKIKTKPYRSFNKDFFVFFDMSPINGCALRHQKEILEKTQFMFFHDPCTGTIYDSAGRPLIENNNATQLNANQRLNLFIPPYTIDNESIIIKTSGTSKIEPPKFSPTGKRPEEIMEYGIKFNDISLVKEGIENGVDLTKTTYPPNKFLNDAIANSSKDIVDFLLANGAQIDETSKIMIKATRREDLEFISK